MVQVSVAKILKDQMGVSHIFAVTSENLFFDGKSGQQAALLTG